jgi:hypothetical protein
MIILLEAWAAQSVWKLDYRLDDRGSITGRDNDGHFFLRHRAETGFAAHPAGTGCFYP